MKTNFFDREYWNVKIYFKEKSYPQIKTCLYYI